MHQRYMVILFFRDRNKYHVTRCHNSFSSKSNFCPYRRFIWKCSLGAGLQLCEVSQKPIRGIK